MMKRLVLAVLTAALVWTAGRAAEVGEAALARRAELVAAAGRLGELAGNAAWTERLAERVQTVSLEDRPCVWWLYSEDAKPDQLRAVFPVARRNPSPEERSAVLFSKAPIRDGVMRFHLNRNGVAWFARRLEKSRLPGKGRKSALALLRASAQILGLASVESEGLVLKLDFVAADGAFPDDLAVLRNPVGTVMALLPLISDGASKTQSAVLATLALALPRMPGALSATVERPEPGLVRLRWCLGSVGLRRLSVLFDAAL